MLTVGSLFTGIAGLDLGLEWAGFGPVVWQVELDVFARTILDRHYPEVDRSVRDVRDAGAATLARVDLICGGFPCQDLSVAGRGDGLSGDRSGLWFEMLRVVRELRPRFVVIENVAALVFRGLDIVLSGLAESGYDAVWFPLRAADVGAPHRRERVFIVAWDRRRGSGSVAAAERGVGERWRGPSAVAGSARPARSEDGERDAEWSAAVDRSGEVGDANGVRRPGARSAASAHEGRAEPDGGHRTVVHADGGRRGPWGDAEPSEPGGRDAEPQNGRGDLADAEHERRTIGEATRVHAGRSLGNDADGCRARAERPWPPGPGDLEGWARYASEGGALPTVCRGTDGPTGQLDASALRVWPFRTRRLKACGNAVVTDCALVVGEVVKRIAEAQDAPYHVKTSSAHGLLDEHVDLALRILQGDEDLTGVNRYGEDTTQLPLLWVCGKCGHKDPASYEDVGPGAYGPCGKCTGTMVVRRKYLSEQAET